MIPKYQHIADRLRAGLTDDGPARITKLPTEKELCQRYQVSRQTVRQALHLLETEGLIIRRQGSGAYATGLHPEAAYNQIAVLLPSDSDYTMPICAATCRHRSAKRVFLSLCTSRSTVSPKNARFSPG